MENKNNNQQNNNQQNNKQQNNNQQNNNQQNKKKLSKDSLNKTDKITLKYMTNPLYNTIIDDKKVNNVDNIILEKEEEIVNLKKEIMHYTKKLLIAIENHEQTNLPDNVNSSFNNYLVNIINYINHRKLQKILKQELIDFNITDSNITENNIYHEIIDLSTNIDNINEIMQKKPIKENNLSKIVKIINTQDKREYKFPNKKNIYNK